MRPRRRTADRRGSCRRLPAGPVADELDLEIEPDAGPRLDVGPDALGEPPHVSGTPLLVVDDEVRVLLGDDRTTAPEPLETRLVDKPTGRAARRVAEHAAGRRQ